MSISSRLFDEELKDRRPEWIVAVVDECPESRDLTRYCLRRSFPDCEVVEFSSADDFLSQSSTLELTAVVTAYQTFGIDGLSLIRELRRRRFLGTVVMLTSSHEKETAAREAGADVFLPSNHWSQLPNRLAAHILGLPANPASNDG